MLNILKALNESMWWVSGYLVCSTYWIRRHMWSPWQPFWCDTLTLIPPHLHCRPSLSIFPPIPCVTDRLGTEQQPCGEMRAKTSRWLLTHRACVWPTVTTESMIHLMWLSFVRQIWECKRAFSSQTEIHKITKWRGELKMTIISPS